METSKINQKEYLRKYLSGSDGTKKKKKKIKVGVKKVKIIDDDVDLKNLRPLEDGEFDILNTTEDAPQIAGIIDERGPVDFTDRKRWKIIADDGEGNIAISLGNNRRDDIYNEDISNHTTENSSRKSSSKSREKTRTYSNNDENLSRKSKKHSDNDLSPPRKSLSRKSSKKRHRKVSSSASNSSSDSSMTSSNSDSTNRKKSKSKKRSIKNEKSKKYDSDLSPPRPMRKHPDDEREVSRRRDDDSDLSPPRKSLRDSYEKSCERDHRHSRRNGSHTDLSPPRKSSGNVSREFKVNKNDDTDLSPPRRSQTNSRHDQHHNSSKNFDASRRDRDKSPRHHRKSRWADESRRSRSPQIDRRMKKTLDGKTAGLQDAAALKEETAAHKKREAEFFNKLSADVSGEGQAAVLRDRKTGRRRNLDAEAAIRREKEKRQEEIDAKYAKWGKGLKQVDDQTEKLKQDLYEMSKPLARYANDADLDAQLRATEREGDPMLEYIKQKQIKEGKREPDRPNYQGSYMPNRFGIKPGHRWDGVDRSNGYEKKWFEARNARTAVQEEAYKWSTADM